MQIKITIFSYEREKMLKALVEEIKAFSSADVSYTIIDDGSSFVLPDNFYQFKHGGKPSFWKMWDYALHTLEKDQSDLFIFTPSDFSNIQFGKIIELHHQFKSRPYAYNLINDGRKKCWNLIEPINIDESTIKIGFTDCGFFCNKKLLDEIGHFVTEVSSQRFVNPNISSGVGQQLTFRINRAGYKIYSPVRSLAYHGDHDSLMHPQERKLNPLISK